MSAHFEEKVEILIARVLIRNCIFRSFQNKTQVHSIKHIYKDIPLNSLFEIPVNSNSVGECLFRSKTIADISNDETLLYLVENRKLKSSCHKPESKSRITIISKDFRRLDIKNDMDAPGLILPEYGFFYIFYILMIYFTHKVVNLKNCLINSIYDKLSIERLILEKIA
ncbi:hypothetical protein HWI79_173 [Cryptosporidium felis]|nr:hypothetical protein HWI79_173 [Cryptosporidium felis]